ncbi:M23 family metallopeptidase [Aeoliella sp.]|uniref:M23 family metallopeptidase n=1 Tax=Aeoliella sp. TaxID=2795800 RepID=UPI003CCBE52A
MFDGDFIYELPFLPGKRFRVIQGYGGSYSHTDESHFSLDFGMPEGTAVCASRSGVVYRVINHFCEGGTHPSFKPKANAIHILHPDDSIGSYVHLMHRGNCVVAGDAVAKGQVIGYSGNTGWSSRPHLHFHVADAVLRKRVATTFRTARRGATQLKNGAWYKRPAPADKSTKSNSAPAVKSLIGVDADASAFSPELLQLARDVAELLAAAGFDSVSNYSSIDALHDVHGLEVCGISCADDTLEITRLLLRQFPGWNAGWIHAPDDSSSQGWVASIQRDRDATDEYWDTD